VVRGILGKPSWSTWVWSRSANSRHWTTPTLHQALWAAGHLIEGKEPVEVEIRKGIRKDGETCYAAFEGGVRIGLFYRLSGYWCYWEKQRPTGASYLSCKTLREAIVELSRLVAKETQPAVEKR
jgi:hypothetical protein